MSIGFEQFFRAATGGKFSAYPYQRHLASEPWPGLLKIPTGMGKTAAVILAWLYKRARNDPDTPRRLVYCLPMRVLVEQTRDCARKWVANLLNSGNLNPTSEPVVSILMGGEVETEWELNPEKGAIIIGTQDQLLSRALNRGYAMSRFRWPVHFGFLNNDCLWVMDEVQLMGSGLAATTQLQSFRQQLGTVCATRSLWMSATLRSEWLETVDFANEAKQLSSLQLSKQDLAGPAVKTRIEARKPIQRASCKAEDTKAVAKMILELHRPGTRTLVVLNKVKRALVVYEAIQKNLNRKKHSPILALVHSRFRPADRIEALGKLLAEPGPTGTICVATQVVEAGVDVSATTLVTDLAPWGSLVQRFGRCNRDGKDEAAQVSWINLDIHKKGEALPYAEEDLLGATSLLEQLHDAGISNLPTFEESLEHTHVLRCKDIIDLFDTTPDLAGLDIDVSRFIRETDDHDVQVFWRDFPKGGPGVTEPGPRREELCAVPMSDVTALSDLQQWKWDHLERKWLRPQVVVPGMLLMLRQSDGRYSSELGWTGDKRHVPELLNLQGLQEEADQDDMFASSDWQTLRDHTTAVAVELEKLLLEYQIPEHMKEVLGIAAIWHDAGKAHEIFQQGMLGDPPEADSSQIWGKTARKSVRYRRVGFRHELASALAMLHHGLPDFAVYLAAAHHGKVRLSIRSLPHETRPPDPGRRYARGIWDGDILPETHLTDGHILPQTTLDLSCMEFGDGQRGESWLSRMLALRDDVHIGIFKLGFLEALLRIADWRASKRVVAKDA